MKAKYWLCKRKEIFFSFDSITGKRESLHTGDREAAKQIIRAKNDAATQPVINISIAKAYLVGTDPKLVERTWALVMQEFCAVKKDSSRLRRERAIKNPAFNFIRNKRLVETTADDFHNVLKSGGVFTQNVLRCPHNRGKASINLATIAMPNSLERIQAFAFQFSLNPLVFYFEGNAPNSEPKVFYGDQVTIYYLPMESGWGAIYGGASTTSWFPALQTNSGKFGVQPDGFGFIFSWASGQTVVVEASTNLITWHALQTNTLTTGTAYFSDPEWTNYAGRLYRLRSP